jgi:hypothetical protein
VIKTADLALKRVVAIVAAGVVVRLLLLLIVDPTANAFQGDSAYYAAGQIDGFRAPLYSLFLRATLPAGIWLPLTIQSCLTIASGVAAYLALRSFWTGLLIAVCPFLALFDFRLLSESLYLNVLWLGWLLLARNRPVGAGLLIGLAILTRDTLLLLPLLTLPLLRTRAALIMAAVAYLISLPWFVTQESGGRLGVNLWIGTWERDGSWYSEHGMNHPDFPPYAFGSQQERQLVTGNWLNDPVERRVAIDRIQSRPLQVAKTWVERYPRLWLGTRSDLSTFRAPRFGRLWTLEKGFFYALNLAFLMLGLWGLTRPDWLFVPPVFYAALIYIPLHAESRYTLFALPFLVHLGVRRGVPLFARSRGYSSDQPQKS